MRASGLTESGLLRHLIWGFKQGLVARVQKCKNMNCLSGRVMDDTPKMSLRQRDSTLSTVKRNEDAIESRKEDSKRLKPSSVGVPRKSVYIAYPQANICK